MPKTHMISHGIHTPDVLVLLSLPEKSVAVFVPSIFQIAGSVFNLQLLSFFVGPKFHQISTCRFCLSHIPLTALNVLCADFCFAKKTRPPHRDVDDQLHGRLVVGEFLVGGCWFWCWSPGCLGIFKDENKCGFSKVALRTQNKTVMFGKSQILFAFHLATLADKKRSKFGSFAQLFRDSNLLRLATSIMGQEWTCFFQLGGISMSKNLKPHLGRCGKCLWASV